MEATLAAENEVRFLTHILYILLHVGEDQVNTEQVHKIMFSGQRIRQQQTVETNVWELHFWSELEKCTTCSQ